LPREAEVEGGEARVVAAILPAAEAVVIQATVKAFRGAALLVEAIQVAVAATTVAVAMLEAAVAFIAAVGVAITGVVAFRQADFTPDEAIITAAGSGLVLTSGMGSGFHSDTVTTRTEVAATMTVTATGSLPRATRIHRIRTATGTKIFDAFSSIVL
jgi:hypothetical protein